MKIKSKVVIALISIFILTMVGLIFTRGFNFISKTPEKVQKEKNTYYCPMHPGYSSNKPGDCPICNMKLIERKTEGSLAMPDKSKGQVVLTNEKNLGEICVEHKCTMKNCPMMVKANLRPGERIICPVCGEVIGTENGKVIEVGKPTQPVSQIENKTTNKEQKILYYRNPMNPQVTSSVPMKDSMGMDYVPIYEEQVSAGPTVSISPEKQQLIGIKTEPVKKINITKIIRASGKIAYDPDLYIAQEEYLQALKTVNATKDSVLKSVTEQSNSLLAASEKKLLLLGMSKTEIDELAKKGSAQGNLYLPIGENSAWAYVSIYEYEIGLVNAGMLVDIEAVAFPGEIFKGKIVSINPVLDPNTRTNQVRVSVEDTSGKLKPEMFVNANIKVELDEKLAVPDSAVLDTGLRKIVYLSRPDDVLEAREVKLGQHAEGYYEVLDGLSEGDIVVTSGNFLVDSESKLKASLQVNEHEHAQ